MKRHGLCALENMTNGEKDIILLQCAPGCTERVKVARAIGDQDVFKNRERVHCD